MSAAGKALATALRRVDRPTFNAPRTKRPPLVEEDFDDIRLHGFDVHDLDFISCTFTKVTFHDLKDVTFTRCTFVDCTFAPNTKKLIVEIDGTNFVECDFSKTAFGPASFLDCRFIEGKGAGIGFSENTTFANSEFRRVADLPKATNLYAIELDPGELSYTAAAPNLLDRVRNWRALAIFAKLPILNVSYIFLVGMAAYAIIASSLLEMMAELLMPLLQTRWSQALALDTIGHLRLLVVPRIETLVVIASFIALAAAGTIYKLSAPSQIQEYSLDKWTLELKRHRLTYESLILVRPRLCAASSLLTLAAFLVLGTLTIVKFVQALSAFAGAAGS